MSFVSRAVSQVTLLFMLFSPCLRAAEDSPAGSPVEEQQTSMAKWVRAWINSPPKTREVSDSLAEDLLKKPMSEAALGRIPSVKAADSSATPQPAKPTVEPQSLQQSGGFGAAPSGEEAELTLPPPVHEKFAGARPKPAVRPKGKTSPKILSPASSPRAR